MSIFFSEKQLTVNIYLFTEIGTLV